MDEGLWPLCLVIACPGEILLQPPHPNRRLVKAPVLPVQECVLVSLSPHFTIRTYLLQICMELLFDIVGYDDIQTEIADAIQTEMETQEQKGSSSNSDTESEASDIGLKDKVSVHAHLSSWHWCV